MVDINNLQAARQVRESAMGKMREMNEIRQRLTQRQADMNRKIEDIRSRINGKTQRLNRIQADPNREREAASQLNDIDSLNRSIMDEQERLMYEQQQANDHLTNLEQEVNRLNDQARDLETRG